MASEVRRIPLRLSRRTWFQLGALLIALIAAVPLWQNGALLNTRGGGDSPFLLQRVQQLVTALADGHFPVRWMPDAAYGYGYPFFNYYAPLSIYVAALFRFLGAPFTTAIQLSQVAAFLLAAWGSWNLARRWLGDDWAALLASAAYTLAPFHLVNVYVRGDSLAEFWAMALYPIVLLAADRLLAAAADRDLHAGGAFFRVVALALAYAALILSHNISALIFSPFLLLYVVLIALSAGRERAWSRLGYAAASLALGLLLSAWFWVPALAETSLVQTGPVTEGYFHYANHFRGLDLVQPVILFNWDVAGQAAFRMGLAQALLIFGGLAALIWKRWPWERRTWERRTWERQHLAGRGRPESGAPGSSRKRDSSTTIFIIITLALATFMITPLSRFVWDTVPLVPYTQFPWRFLSVQALAGALASGALALLPGRRWWALGGAVLLLAAMLPTLRTEHITLRDADVTPLRLAQYEWFTANIGTTVSAEYLPQAVQPRPYTSAWLNSGERDAVQVLSGEAQAELGTRRATSQVWDVQVAADGAQLALPTFYWPGWQARLDGQPLSLSPAPGSGLITVDVPGGVHSLELRLGRTPIRLVAELLSLGALLTLILWSALRRRALLAAFWQRWRLAILAVLALLLLLSLFGRLRPARQDDGQTLSWDFAQLGYLHRAPQGIRFAGGARLLGYDYNSSTVAAGETARVTLRWSENGDEATATTLDLLTPATHRSAYAPILASVSKAAGDGGGRYDLSVPQNAPPGLYVVRLTRDDSPALTPSGQPRGPLFLRPLRVVAGGAPAKAERALDARIDEVLVPPTMPDIVPGATGLFDCAARRPSPGALQVHLSWLTQRPLARNLTASLRLIGADGARLAQCDAQPGYGFLPSGIWTPGTWTPDRLALPLPPSLPPSEPFVLTVTLYDSAGTMALTRRLGQLRWQDGALTFAAHKPQFALPADAGVKPLQARFGEAIALRGYALHQTGDALSITLYWEALQEGRDDLTRFVHLLGDEGAAPLVQQDGAPQNNSYPTAQWTAGEIVADTVILDLSGIIAALEDLRLAVGFYPPQDPTDRLPVRDALGNPLHDNRLLIRPQGGAP